MNSVVIDVTVTNCLLKYRTVNIRTMETSMINGHKHQSKNYTNKTQSMHSVLPAKQINGGVETKIIISHAEDIAIDNIRMFKEMMMMLKIESALRVHFIYQKWVKNINLKQNASAA